MHEGVFRGVQSARDQPQSDTVRTCADRAVPGAVSFNAQGYQQACCQPRPNGKGLKKDRWQSRGRSRTPQRGTDARACRLSRTAVPVTLDGKEKPGRSNQPPLRNAVASLCPNRGAPRIPRQVRILETSRWLGGKTSSYTDAQETPLVDIKRCDRVSRLTAAECGSTILAQTKNA